MTVGIIETKLPVVTQVPQQTMDKYANERALLKSQLAIIEASKASRR